MKKISSSDIAEMPIDERIQLVEDICDSIAELPDTVPVPEWHRKELAAYEWYESQREGLGQAFDIEIDRRWRPLMSSTPHS